MLVPFLTAFIIPLIITLAITPLVIRLANKIGAVDKPAARKVHHSIIPRMGGTAIYLAVLGAFTAIYSIFPSNFIGFYENTTRVAIIVVSISSIFALGFWDDLKPLKAGTKFTFQFVIAALIYLAGFKISNITNPLGIEPLNLEIIDFPLTVIWIVGITNAFNLIDGLDGLASGVATIASICIFTVSAISGQPWAAILSLILAGALVGFLRYNFHPARIFLGDSGSLLIGFSLALLSIQSTAKITTGFAILFPLLVLLLPITDTLISMLRRLFSGYLSDNRSGLRSSFIHKIHCMFTPDKSHIHHQLLTLGFSHRNTVILLYFVSAFFATGAFSITRIITVEGSLLAFIIIGTALYLGIKKLKYHEIAIFNNGLLLPVYERWILNRTHFISLIDLCFIVLSFSLSYLLVGSGNPVEADMLRSGHTVAILISVQLITFWLTGLYREKLRQMGIGDVIGITGSVIYAITFSAVVLLVGNTLTAGFIVQFLTFNFYILLTFTIGLRIAYQAMSFWFHRDNRNGENVLIYGSNEDGSMMLHKINETPGSNLRVIGFLDDDPTLEGKLVYGYPIFGGHWKLAKTLSSEKIDTIYICENQIKPENYNRLRTIANRHGVKIKRVQMIIHEIKDESTNGDYSTMNNVTETIISYS